MASELNEIKLNACKKVIEWLDIRKFAQAEVDDCEGFIVYTHIEPEELLKRIEQILPGLEITPDETQPLPKLPETVIKPKYLISLSGKSGAGKTTAGKFLEKVLDYKAIAFGDSVKDVIAFLFGIKRSILQGDDPESKVMRLKPLVNAPMYSMKRIMQLFATEVIRDFNRYIWISHLEKRMDSERIVITDARYPNEMDFIKEYKGCSIRIDSEIDEDKCAPDHSSEEVLADAFFNYIIDNNNQDIHCLYKRLILIDKQIALDNFYKNN